MRESKQELQKYLKELELELKNATSSMEFLKFKIDYLKEEIEKTKTIIDNTNYDLSGVKTIPGSEYIGKSDRLPDYLPISKCRFVCKDDGVPLDVFKINFEGRDIFIFTCGVCNLGISLVNI